MCALSEMESTTILILCSRRMFGPLCGLVLLFGYLATASPTHGRRLICWRAIMKCHGEQQCHYAYEQYLHACASVLRDGEKKCPSHCISSLVQLNMTKNGPALEDCDCASDVICSDMKRSIEPCLPRLSSMGCTEARRQCENDSQCNRAMSDYFNHCIKLFGGVMCTDACRNVIEHMRSVPKAELLDTCVCDGAERTVCEYIKLNMNSLCYDTGNDYTGSGFFNDDSEPDDMPDDLGDEESSGSFARAQDSMIAMASLFALLSHL